MKRYLPLFALFFLLAACGGSDAQLAREGEKLAQRYMGTYEGTLPCADCPGIETELIINPDFTFALIELYQDEDGDLFLTEGGWELDPGQQYIILTSNDGAERYYYSLNGADLIRLDMQAKPIDSGLNYTLRRK